MRFQGASKPYYGWYITITLALTEMISWGVLFYIFSVFLEPMEAELGWSRAELTGGFSLAMLVMGALAFPVGTWIDRHGARLLMTAGSILATLLVIAWSQVTNIVAYYAIWAGLGVCAAAVLYEPAFAVIAQWFRLKRSVALAVVTFVAGLASMVFLPLSDALMHSFGWRTATLQLGIFMGLITIPLHALILRRRPGDLGLRPDGSVVRVNQEAQQHTSQSLGTAMHDPLFWMLTTGFGLMVLAAWAMRVHFIPFLTSSGVDPTTAAFATGAIGLTQVIGRVGFAPLEKRLSSATIAVSIFALHIVAMLILLTSQATIPLIAFIVLFGAVQGAATLARPSIIAELYGVSHFARISSVMSIFQTLAMTAAPIGASLIYDRAQSYQPVLWVATGLFVVALFSILLARRKMPKLPQTQVLMTEPPQPAQAGASGR
jgi:MFS family permease